MGIAKKSNVLPNPQKKIEKNNPTIIVINHFSLSFEGTVRFPLDNPSICSLSHYNPTIFPFPLYFPLFSHYIILENSPFHPILSPIIISLLLIMYDIW